MESCCFSFKDDENFCNGFLIWFFKWLFLVFDVIKSVYIGILICGVRLLLIDKVDRIRRMERYIILIKVYVRVE